MTSRLPSSSGAVKQQQGSAQGAGGRRSGRKGEQQDLNHLLGFTLPPRAPQPTLTHLPRRSNNRSSGRSGGSGWHGHGGAFDRARFVHTFRFIVKPDKDYTAHFADPDLHLDWADILQVILPTSSSALSTVTTGARNDQGSESGKSACPICLSEPTAPRMTKCGHVFCFPCVLHYLALADPGIKFRNCPVCHDSIYAKDLKSVKWFDPVKDVTSPCASALHAANPSTLPPSSSSAEPIDAELARALELSRLDSLPVPPSSAAAPSARKASFTSASTASHPDSHPQPHYQIKGERLTLRLIRRPQLTTLALPRSSTWPSEAVPPLRAPWQFTPDALAFAKFMLGEPSYIREELLSQRAELEEELRSLRRMAGGRAGQASDEELGTVFVKEAMRRVDEQVQKTELLKTTPVMTARKKARRELEEIEEDEEGEVGEAEGELAAAAQLPPPVPMVPVEDNVPLEFLAARSGSASGSGTSTPLSFGAAPFLPSSTAASPAPAAVSPPPKRAQLSAHTRRNVLPSAPSASSSDPSGDSYYFYQSSSGQPIFLTPLDIRVLKSHFGTYAAMPSTIEVKVEGADEGSMNDELRKRCKWLAHLPRGSDVVFVEADLSSVVPRRALEPFAGALKARRHKRKDKARKEDNAKKRAETKAREELPLYHSTYAFGEGVPLSLSQATSSSWEDTVAFPAPPSLPRAPSAATSSPPPSRTASARPSFASALHASSRSTPSYSAWDDDYDDRWGDLEEQLGRQRAAAGPRSGAATPASTATVRLGEHEAGAQEKVTGGGGGGNKAGGQGAAGGKNGRRGKKGGITLSLTGGARG
ncbi:hypothetical protein JCM11251_004167 [Rhodosporidiobolus azoricus]